MALKQGGFGGVQPPLFAHKMIRIAPPDCKHGMLLEYDRKYAWAWVLWSPYVLGTRTGLCSGHVPWSLYALGTRTEVCPGHGCSGRRMFLASTRELCFGHGRSGNRMSLKHERNHVASLARNPCVRCQACLHAYHCMCNGICVFACLRDLRTGVPRSARREFVPRCDQNRDASP